MRLTRCVCRSARQRRKVHLDRLALQTSNPLSAAPSRTASPKQCAGWASRPLLSVAMLRGSRPSLVVRLFQRSTRRLTLIEAGERFLQSVAGGLEDIQNTIAGVSADAGQASGGAQGQRVAGLRRGPKVPLLPEFI